MILGCFGPLGGTWEAIGIQTPNKAALPQKKPTILEVNLESFWSPGGIKNRIVFLMFFEGSFGGLLAHLGAKGLQKSVIWSNFGALLGNKWKCENYAPVQAGASKSSFGGYLFVIFFVLFILVLSGTHFS